MKKPHSRYRYILRIQGVLHRHLYYPSWSPDKDTAARMTWRQACRAAHRLILSSPIEIVRVRHVR